MILFPAGHTGQCYLPPRSLVRASGTSQRGGTMGNICCIQFGRLPPLYKLAGALIHAPSTCVSAHTPLSVQVLVGR